MPQKNPLVVTQRDVIKYLEGQVFYQNATLVTLRKNGVTNLNGQIHRLEIARHLLTLAKRAYREKTPIVQLLMELQTN